MIPRALFRLLQCPTCQSRSLWVAADGVHCAGCRTVYPMRDGYLDMLPRGMAFDYVSKYVAEEQQLA